MGSELMPQCGACGSRGTRKVGAETAAPAVGCHCGVIVTGFTEAEATERWERLSRRAEIGALVEEMCRNGSLDGPLKVFPSRLVDGPVRVSLATFALGVRNGEAATLLDALRALAAAGDVD